MKREITTEEYRKLLAGKFEAEAQRNKLLKLAEEIKILSDNNKDYTINIIYNDKNEFVDVYVNEND
jgi:hypothetical protein